MPLAAGFGHIRCLRSLIEKAADISQVNATTLGFGSTPLMVAVEKQQLGAVRFLLNQGADVNLKDDYGFTALHLAAISSMYEVVICLVENGADVNAVNFRDVTPLMMACDDDSNMDVVRYLMRRGADVHLKDVDGFTALLYAITSDSDFALDILRFLIQNGADVNTRNLDEATPLMLASWNGYLDKVKFLIEQGADVDAQDHKGNTALNHAAGSTDEPSPAQIVNTLLIAGASHLSNTSGLTPLLTACNSRSVDVVEFLIKQPEITKQQRCDALELLGASILTYTVGRQEMNSEDDVEKGLEYIRVVMAERLADPSNLLPKRPVVEPVEAYQFRKESQTVEELAEIEGDMNAQLMESLITRERILGADNVELTLPITECVPFYFENNDFATYLGFYKRAFNIAKSHNQSAIIGVLNALIDMLHERVNDLPKEMIFLQLLDQLIHDYTNVLHMPELKDLDHKLLYESLPDLLTIVSKFKDSEELLSMSEFVKSIHGLNLKCHGLYGYATSYTGNSLLRKYVRSHGRGENHTDEVKFLLGAGCDVNTVDQNGNTLLHMAVTFKPRHNDTQHLTEMLQILLDGGAHHDFVNNDGKTPMDMTRTEEARVILSERKQMKLKCICAKAVKKFCSPYLAMGEVPVTLDKFISMH